MWMKHPNLPDNEPAEVTDSAFNTVWRHRGWQEADPPADPEPDQREPDLIETTLSPGEAVIVPEARPTTNEE